MCCCVGGGLMAEKGERFIVDLLLPAALQFLIVFLTPSNYLPWYHLHTNDWMPLEIPNWI